MHVMYVQSCHCETHDLSYEASVQHCATFKMKSEVCALLVIFWDHMLPISMILNT